MPATKMLAGMARSTNALNAFWQELAMPVIAIART